MRKAGQIATWHEQELGHHRLAHWVPSSQGTDKPLPEHYSEKYVCSANGISNVQYT